MQQLRDEDYVAVTGSLRYLASKSIGNRLKENLAGCKWSFGSTAELVWILDKRGINLGAEQDPDSLDGNPKVASSSWKLSLVLRLLFVACFVLAVYAVATGDDQGLTEKFVEPALHHLWKHSEEFVEPVLYRLYKRFVQHEMRDLLEEQLAIYQAKVQEESQKVEERLAIYQAKVQEETQKAEKLAANQDKLAANHGELAANQDKLAANHGELAGNQTVLKEGVEKLAAHQDKLAANQKEFAAQHDELADNLTVLKEDAKKLAADQEELAANQTVLQQNFGQLKAVSQLGQFSDWLDFMQIAMRLCPNCSETFLNWVKTLVYLFTCCILPLEKLAMYIGKRFNWPKGEKFFHFVRVSIQFVLQYVFLIIVLIHASEIWNGVIGFWNSANENWTKMVEIWSKMMELYKSANSLVCVAGMGLTVLTFIGNFGFI